MTKPTVSKHGRSPDTRSQRNLRNQQ